MRIANNLWLVAVLGVMAFVGVARAQTETPEQLKTEVDRLKVENADLRTQIEALQGQVRALQGQLAALRGQQGTPVVTEKLAPIPPDPLAAPAAMLAELIRRYERDLGGVLKSDGPPDDGSKATVEKWAKVMGRTMRGRAEWLVTIHDVREEKPGQFSALLRVIDEATGLPIGQPWRQEFPARFVDKVDQAQRQTPKDQSTLWRATVLMSAVPVLDWERTEVGPYNAPPFVGPFVEFDFGLDWVLLLPADKQLPAAPAKPEEKPRPPATAPR